MITRSNSKKIRENVRRLPHEVEATLPSWVKCTDPIPREILEEVRSTVLVWMKNVRNYVEETETYILNDEHVHQEIVEGAPVRRKRNRARAQNRARISRPPK